METPDYIAIEIERNELISKMRTIQIKTDSLFYYDRNPSVSDLMARLKEIENIARVK
jgi:hypothetical protein